jgi:hypothetical protein
MKRFIMNVVFVDWSHYSCVIRAKDWNAANSYLESYCIAHNATSDNIILYTNVTEIYKNN